MKLSLSKILPWIVVFLSFCGNVYVYAQTNTSHEERIKVLEIQQNKQEDKQNKQYDELTKLFREIDRKVTRALALLEK